MAAVVTMVVTVWTHHGDVTMRVVNMFFIPFFFLGASLPMSPLYKRRQFKISGCLELFREVPEDFPIIFAKT